MKLSHRTIHISSLSQKIGIEHPYVLNKGGPR